jgi:uncharacterized iron-regulated membrane protein
VARLDRASGAVTVRRSAEWWALAAALHEGRFGGLASRWLYVAAGLTPVALALTGLGIWLARPAERSTGPVAVSSPRRGHGEEGG